MGVSTHSIEVNAPLTAVYNQWTQFEEFPHFMDGVEEVRQEGGERLFFEKRRSPRGSKNGQQKLQNKFRIRALPGKVSTERWTTWVTI
jgi:hypothetical protein